jgi:chromosomal replication initiator protein
MTNAEIFKESPISSLHLGKCSMYGIPGLKYRPKQATYLLPDAIINVVLKHFGFWNIKQLTSKSRKTEVVYARQVCYYLLRKKTKLSVVAIGRMFGDRDHTTIVHAIGALQNLMDTEPAIRNEVMNLKDSI